MRPPRIARALLRLLVPADVRDSVDGDLAELHAAHTESRGRASATLWYWQEALSFGVRFPLERIQHSERSTGRLESLSRSRASRCGESSSSTLEDRSTGP